MEPRIDEMVLRVQQWLNETYGNDSRFNRVNENGKTGWETIYGLRRALQIELGIQNTSDSFGPTTYSLCPTITQGTENNMVYIIQGGLWCKGYNPGGFNGYYGPGTYAAVKALKSDAGFPSASGNMQRDFMKALLDMSAFVCLPQGKEEIRKIQQQLNYDYYDYYQISPCDGLYNREMNKMLIYALQKELGISKSSATGTWGPTTISNCKQKLFGVGSSDPLVKLVRYAVVCNGFSVSTSSSTYDSTLDDVLQSFCESLSIVKQVGKCNYTVIKSLLSSNGDTDRSALGCDTATRLSSAQIQTIKNAGYKFVGRYISNTPGGTLNKALTRNEMENILNSGLKLFYIFQESNNSASDFNVENGIEQAKRALSAIYKLGIPNKATIYFAVDCDPLDTEIIPNVLNYFISIFNVFDEHREQYGIGVYGTRNVCQKLKEHFGKYIHVFVSDASYGFSGNLGFTIPNNWAFDQFKTDITIGSGNGQVSIDKVAVSYRDDCNYGDLIPFYEEEEDDDDSDYQMFYPTATETAKQGLLMVNLNEKGLHIYKRVRNKKDDFLQGYDYASPKTRDLMYLLPKNAFYVDIGLKQYSAYSDRVTHLIKFLDNDGEVNFGFIPVNNIVSMGDGVVTGNFEPQIMTDIKEYDLQRDFLNYVVGDDHNSLVASKRVSIDDHNCVIYKLKKDVNAYDFNNNSIGIISKDTEIAICENSTGESNNKLIQVFRKKINGKWEAISSNSETGFGFIEYLLEEGCMPKDRIINN